jgi:hypothetical protein
MLNIPLSPSTATSLQSAAVSHTIARRLYFPGASGVFPHATDRTHSAAERVFPNPRPAKIIHVCHLPSGATCAGLAQNGQCVSIAFRAAGDSASISRVLSGSGNEARYSAGESIDYFVRVFDRLSICSTVLDCRKLWMNIWSRRLGGLESYFLGFRLVAQQR